MVKKMQMKEGKTRKRRRKPSDDPGPNLGGRPLELTQEMIDQFSTLIKSVVYMETAANYIGVDRVTLSRWVRQGRNLTRTLRSSPTKANDLSKEDVLLVRFYLSLKRALAEAEINRLAIIDKASKKVWTAAAWVLERTMPHKYGTYSREIRDLQKELRELMKQVGKEK